MKNYLKDDQLLKNSINEVKQTHLEFVKELKEDLNEGQPSDLMTKEFYELLVTFFNDDSLNEYSPLKFYWLNQLERYIYILQIHEDIESASSEDFVELEEEIFNYWNDNEYSYLFKDFLDEEDDIVASSFSLLRFLENHILGFYQWHFSKDVNTKDNFTMHACEEIGDNNRYITISENGYGIELPNSFESYPVISFKSKNNKNVVLTDKNNKSITLEIKKISTDLVLNNTTFKIIPNKDFDDSKKEIIDNLKRALDIYEKNLPELFSKLSMFTHTIIPVKQEEIVSFSLQSLPGYSTINLFHRDFIDLLDDLIHENGHHILNSFLNHQDLINEDDEVIYWSPWRNALRPIRGIYHAYLTFFWAHELFETLLLKNSDLDFNKEQQSKIQKRLAEENFMLRYCHSFLKHALENEKINNDGQKLIDPILENLNKSIDTIKMISPEILTDLNESFDLLNRKKTEYSL